MRFPARLPFLALLLALAPAAARAQAPQVQGTDLPRLGLGVSLRSDGTGYAFQVPILFPRAGTASAFRVEPYVDISRRTFGDAPNESESNTYFMGVTGSYVFNVFPYAFGSVGGGFSVSKRSIQNGTNESDSGTGKSFFVTAGGECFLHPRLSLGIGATMGIESLPKLQSGPTPTTSKSSEFFTSGFLAARFYYR